MTNNRSFTNFWFKKGHLLKLRRTIIHVGMDLHPKSSYVRAITDEGELVNGRRINHSDIDKLWDYLGQFGEEEKRVVFEATSNARWMYRLLKEDTTIDPIAVTPHKVRIIAETVAKTDKIDAKVLANLSKMDALPRAWIPDEEVEDLRELTRHRADLVSQRTRAKNRVNGILIRRGIIRPYGDIFGKLGREWLDEIELPMAMQLQVKHWLDIINSCDRKIASVETKLYKHLAKKPRWSSDIKILETMPGWGKLTALTILAELGDYRRFKRRSSISCFVGLVPTSKRSDRSIKYGKITKRGSIFLRRILIEVSIHGARRVPRYKRLFLRLKKAKGTNIAKTAVARQMLEDGWTMLVKREPFRSISVQAGNLAWAG
jgi:transposase